MSELLIAAFIGAAVAVVIAAARIARAAAARESRATAMEAVARRYALGDLSRPELRVARRPVRRERTRWRASPAATRWAT